MKYRKTFREALKDMDKKDKPEAKPESPAEISADDYIATIKQLQAEIQQLKSQAILPPMPNPDTGEIPLRVGIASALLDKKGPSPKIVKDNKKKLKMSLGKTKVEINPDVDIGQISGGIQTGTGNLH